MVYSSSHLPLLLFILVQLIVVQNYFSCRAHPTDGFSPLPLNQSNFQMQKPYDVPVNQSFIDGVHKFWVFKTDKPHAPTSQTKPRTEILIKGYEYSSGVWQFVANLYVPRGTSGVSIMQVFGAAPPVATTLVLRVYNGNLYYYREQVIESNIYNRWFRLNVIQVSRCW
ncbi:hypothetical protein P3L10_033029 [Capsicum annuum]